MTCFFNCSVEIKEMSVAVSKNISEILRAVDLKNPKLSTLASKGTDQVGKYAFSRRDCVPI